ncbi:hypothetical protein AAFP30_15730 [Gordonia sp. CPCC 205515]|uniref:hypothetical protein n=1 Tax=Gordonia sp. CPCC 205515 TaxID=3140791 RepID=UPI003AF3FEE1
MLAAVSGVLAIVGMLPSLPAGLRVVFIAPMVLVGLGIATTWPLDVSRDMRWALYPSIGLAAPIGVATCLLWLDRYSWPVVTASLAAVCIGSGGIALWRHRDLAPLPDTLRRSTSRWIGGLGRALSGPGRGLALPVLVWVGALALLRDADVGLFGLLGTSGGVLLVVSLVLTVIIFVSCIVAGDTGGAAIAIIVTAAMIRLPVSLLTEVPIYAWTYKHIGLVDFVTKTGALPPSYVDIYSRWPGFFAGAAWFSATTGVDPVDVAHWFAPVMHFVLAAAIWSLSRALGLSMRAALIAVFCAELVNWVGQDYYSPQAVALVLGVTVIALFAGSRRDTAAAYFTIPLVGVLACTHQLTPVWVLACCGLLTVINRVRPLWLILVCVAVWVGYFLPRMSSVMKYGLFTGSNPLNNAKTNIGSATGDSMARTVTETVDRGVAFAVWLSAIVAFAYLWRHRKHDWALPIVAFSPILLLGGQSYGGEAIFRVFLYSLIGCSMLVGAALGELLPDTSNPSSACRFPRMRQIFGTFALAVVGVGALHGYYSGWAYNVVTKSQVSLSRQLLADAAPSTVIVRMAPAGWPERPSADYVPLAEANPGYDRPLVFLKNSLSRGFPTEEDIGFLNNLGRFADGGFYLVLPRQMAVYSDYFGYFRPGAIDSLIRRLDREPNWHRTQGDSNTVIFRYQHQPTEREPW